MSQVIVCLRKTGLELHRFLEARNRLLVPAEICQRISQIEVRSRRARVAFDRRGEHGQGFFVSGLLHQGKREEVMRLDKVRKSPYLLLQDLRGPRGISQSEVAIAEVVAEPFGVYFVKHLAQRRHGLLKSALQKQTRAKKAQGIPVAWILPQRGSRDFLRRAKFVALERLPTRGTVIPPSFGFSHQSHPMDNENLACPTRLNVKYRTRLSANAC